MANNQNHHLNIGRYFPDRPNILVNRQLVPFVASNVADFVDGMVDPQSPGAVMGKRLSP